MKRAIYIITSIILLAGCSQEPIPTPPSDAGAIYLAAVSEVAVETRAPYKYTTPNENADGVLYTEVWASSKCDALAGNYTFPNEGLNGKDSDGNSTAVAIHTKADFDSGVPQLLNQAVYPHSGSTVYFVGLHPQSKASSPGKWEVDYAGKKASIVFDGSHDVMYAPRVEGKYAEPGNMNAGFDVPTLHFRHLLTWLKFNIIADEAKTVEAWGKITKMQLTSKNGCSINIGYADTFDVNNSDCVTYSEVGNDGLLDLRQTSDDGIFPAAGGYSLKTTRDEVAYILCSPVKPIVTEVIDGDDVHIPEYTLYIESEFRKNVVVPIDLKVNASEYFGEDEVNDTTTRSRCFTINLTFKMGNTIVVTADVTDWDLGGGADVEM